MRRMQRGMIVALTLTAACQTPVAAPKSAPGADAAGFTAPSQHTRDAIAELTKDLALADQQDFEDVKHGLIETDPNLVIKTADGTPSWDLAAYSFVQGQAPDSVNPSLWRQAQLNGVSGLFQVAEGIYQVRGYDISNMSWIRGHEGWIIVDPLTSEENAAAAVQLARKHLGNDPITAVIFTHSHADHFGGVNAVLPTDAAARAKVRIIAPRRFMEESTSENVMAGLAMGRRGSFMFGINLPRTARGHVDTGLGKGIQRGRVGIAAPTEIIDHTSQTLDIDGVHFVFQFTPDAEAPAEMTFYIPEHKAFCGAEVVTHTLHNVYTLRGAKVRDALKWSGYIDEAIGLFPDVEVVFASHNWPVWGNARVIQYLKGQRDTYKYIHDQTLRLANLGLTPREIAEQVELPPSLAKQFANRGYYGTVRHNVKAVYQLYFGWYDSNPANLDPLPPVDEGKKYVEAMGGAAEVKKKAHEASERGDYRWAATLLDHLVFAAPEDAEARGQLADVYDQLGYRAESGPWRDEYLTGALELRRGIQGTPISLGATAGLLQNIPVENFFTAMATLLNGPKAVGQEKIINFVFTDLGETHVLSLENAVLHHHKGEADPKANATVRLTHDFFLKMVTGQAGLREMIFSDDLKVDGSRLDVLSFLSLFQKADGQFAIVTP